MARFYDTVSDLELNRIENLLRKGGIEYSLRILGDAPPITEIMIAEEDMIWAEEVIFSGRGFDK